MPSVSPAAAPLTTDPLAASRELLHKQGVNPDELVDLKQLIERATALKLVYIAVHSSAFFGAPDVALVLSAIQKVLGTALNSRYHTIQIVLLVDGTTDADDAKRQADNLAKAIPEASLKAFGHAIQLPEALILPAPVNEQQGRSLLLELGSLESQGDRTRTPEVLVIGPGPWLSTVKLPVSEFRFDPKAQQNSQTMPQLARLVTEAVKRVIQPKEEPAITANVQTEPPDEGIPNQPDLFELPSLTVEGDLQARVNRYRSSVQEKMRSLQAVSTQG